MLRVFTEGFDDLFVKIYLERLGYVSNENFSIDNANGWTNIHLIKPKIQEYLDAGDEVVLVFDADFDANGGGFNKRHEEIEAILDKETLDLDFFLFPNNSEDGDFETLLERIAHPDRLGVFKCFDGYEDCISGLQSETLKFRFPLRKSRIFAYIESFDESNRAKNKEIKERTYFYDNPRYWDLDSPFLLSLKDFLTSKL